MLTISKTALWVLIVVLASTACVEVKEPSAPDVVVKGGGDGSTNCKCSAKQMRNRAYRFTSVAVIDPWQLTSELNRMWEGEIYNHILNVLFVVTDAVEGETPSITAFDSMKIVAGPGWREPKTPYIVDEDFSATAYSFLQGLQFGMSMDPVSGYQCQLKNHNPESLFFHLGPLNEPFMCGPKLDTTPNATPIKDLALRFSFSANCETIENGYMRGCLAEKDVDRICLCSKASECPRTGGDPASERFPNIKDYPKDEQADVLVDYCKDTCGFDEDAPYNWTSFGALVRTVSMVKTCITTEGDEGYLLEAIFNAEEVTELFDFDSMPEISEDYFD